MTVTQERDTFFTFPMTHFGFLAPGCKTSDVLFKDDPASVTDAKLARSQNGATVRYISPGDTKTTPAEHVECSMKRPGREKGNYSRCFLAGMPHRTYRGRMRVRRTDESQEDG